jgi:hypothetical protein
LSKHNSPLFKEFGEKLNMPFNDILPQFTPHSLKGAIIETLSEESLLNAKQIHSKIKIDKDISYQAVHKALNELEQVKIIQKEGRIYSINQEWIDILIKKLNQIKSNKTGKTGQIKINKNSKSPQIFKFKSYSRLCVTIAELLKSRVLAKKRDTSFICTLEYGWFPFKFKFGDFLTLGEMMQANPGAINIIRTDTPLGRWICKQYKRINAVCAPIGTKVNIDHDLFAYEDYIIEIRFSKESKAKIKHYYNKIKSLNGIYREFALKKEPEMDITVTITKNPSLSKFLGSQLRETYKEAIKKNK